MSNRSLLMLLDNLVYGHSTAKKLLITALARSKLRQHQKYVKNMHDDYIVLPMKILLIGASGTGKTHLVESLRKIHHFPFVRVDATDLMPTGAGKGVKSDDLRQLIMQAAQEAYMTYPEIYIHTAGAIERTFVFIDELDKLGCSWESSGNWNKHTQSNFLTIFDAKDEFAGVSFIFAGAFTDIRKEKQFQNKKLGFLEKNTNEKDNIEQLSDEDIVKFGLIPELVGRINSIVELDVFTKDNLYDIITSRIIPKKKIDLASCKIFDIDIPDYHIDKIVTDALKSCQGVRYMQREVDKFYLEHEFDIDIDHIITTGQKILN